MTAKANSLEGTRARDHQQPLALAARALDRARGPLRRRDPGVAVELWRGLVAGRWSLVHRFDSEGRRFLLVQKNDPSTRDPRGLTERERQILGYADLGQSNKVIAYELGISPSTVAVTLMNAGAKLRRMTGNSPVSDGHAEREAADTLHPFAQSRP